MRKLMLFLVILLLAGILATAAYVGYEAYLFLHIPPEIPGQEVMFEVKPGETFEQAAQRLRDKGLITNVQYFVLLGKYKKRLGSIQAGEFKLNTGWKPEKVLETLVSGKPILYRLSIREGLTWWETARLVEKAGYADYDDFARLVRDPEILEKYDIPFDSAEGFLFPDTYLLKRPKQKSAKPVVELLLRTFWKHAKEIWPDGPKSPEELKEKIILASIVEKETGAANERARIAGVYTARLKRGMLLQCDPTIIYGLGLRFDGNLKKSHLADNSNPYNTYQHPGLPPGPICSPGLESLLAAVNPEKHNYLYFVSKNDGSHYFSKSLREHNNAVNKYQRRRRR